MYSILNSVTSTKDPSKPIRINLKSNVSWGAGSFCVDGINDTITECELKTFDVKLGENNRFQIYPK